MKATVKVLLVDDNDASRKALARYLRLIGEFEVKAYGNGQDALVDLKTNWRVYTAVLLDYVLSPELSGADLFHHIQEQYPGLPVIVFTGMDPAGGSRTLAEGAYAYKRRPLDHIEIVTIIRDLAEQGLILFQMARDIKAILLSKVSVVWQLERTKQQFQVAAWSDDLDSTHRRLTLDARNPDFQHLMQKGAPIILEGMTEVMLPTYYPKELVVQQNWQALISIPLIHDQHLIGFIDNYYETPTTILHKEDSGITQRLLTAFANQAAGTMLQADLARRAQAVQEINQSLADIQDEETILQQILAKALDLVGAEIGWLYLVDVQNNKLVLKTAAGIPLDLLEEQRAIHEGITGHVAQERRAYNAPDVSQVSFFKPTPAIEVKSEVAIPLRRGELCIGVLTAKSPYLNAFTNHDVDLLISLATQAAITIERAKLTKYLQGVSELALDVEDFAGLAQYVVDAVQDLTGAEIILWMMSDRPGERDRFLRIVAHTSQIDQVFAENALLPVDGKRSINALSLEKKAPIILRDVLAKNRDHPFYYAEQARQYGWRSFMAVPLIGREEKRLGVLSLHGQAISKFGQAEARLMGAFANQAAVVFQQKMQALALQNLAHISQTFTESLVDKPKKLLQEVANVAQTLTNADCVVIYPYDFVRRRFFQAENIVAAGLKHPLKEVTKKPRRTGLAALVRQKGAIIVRDVLKESVVIGLENSAQEDETYEEILDVIHKAQFIEREDIGAFIGISLRAHEKVANRHVQMQEVGVLYINFRTPHNFTQEELQVIKIYTHQVANIIRGARLFAEAQRQANELRAVHETALRIVAHERLQPLLTVLVEEAAQLLEAKGGKVYLRVEGEEKLELVAAKGINPHIWPIGSTLSFGEGLAGQVIQMKKPRIINSYGRWSGRIEVLKKSFTAVIDVPLLLEEEAIGVLSVFDDIEKRRFTKNDIPILQRLAQQAALAIHQATLHTQSQRQLKVLNELHEVALQIPPEADFDLIMNVLIERATDLVTDDSHEGIGVGYWLCDYDKNIAILKKSTNPQFMGMTIHLNESLISQVVQTGKGHFINDYPNWPYHAQIFDQKKLVHFIQNVIEVPLIVEGKVVAILAVTDASGQRRFNEGDIQILERLVDLAAINLQRVDLYNASQQRIHDLEIINNIVETLETKLNPDDLLQTVVNYIGEQLNCRRCTLFFPQEEDNIVWLESNQTYGTVTSDSTWRFRMDEGIVGLAYQSGETIVVPNTAENEYFMPRTDSDLEPRSMLVVPIRVGSKNIGLISADHDQPHHFDDYDKQFVDALASHVGIAVERANTLHLLQKIGNEIISSKKIRDILQQIVEGAIRLTQTSLGAFYLLDRDEQSVRRHVQYPLDVRLPWPRLERSIGITHEVIQKRTHIVIPDIHQDSRPNRRLHDFFNSLIAVPLNQKERIIGVLYLFDKNPHDFTETEVTILSTLASQAVIAIENATLFQRLTRLQEISSTISISLDIERIMKLIAEGAVELTDTASGIIYLIDETEIKISHAYAYPPQFHHLQPRFNEKRGLTWEVFQTGEIVEVPSVSRSKRVAARMRQGDIKSTIGVPLKLPEGIIGVLFLNSHKERTFSDDEKEMLTTLAVQAALAIENAGRYEQRAHDLQALEQINEAIINEEISYVTQLIITKASQLTKADYGVLRLLDESEQYLEKQATYGRSNQTEKLPFDDSSFSGWVATRGEGAYAADVNQALYYLRLYDDVQSCMAVPLKRQTQTIGVMFVESTRKRAFSQQQQLDLLQSLANQAAIALENTTVYRERVQDITALQKINEAVVTESYEEILNIIVQEVTKVMPGEHSALWLVEPSSGDLLLEAIWGPQHRSRPDHKYRIKSNQPSINMQVLQSGQRYISDDVAQESHFYRIYEEAQSSLTVPLKYRTKVIGTLNLESSRKKMFRPQHAELMDTFSDLAAVAIENARLFRQTEEQRDHINTQREAQIRAVGEIARSINTSLELEAILRGILEWTISLMNDANLVEVRIFYRESEELEVLASSGEPIPEAYKRLHWSRGVTGWVAQKGKPKIISDVNLEADYVAGRPETKSEMAVPMLSDRNELLGVLNIEHAKLNAFDEQDLKLAEAIASLAVVAINNNRYVTQLEDRADRLTRLQETTTAISAKQSNLDSVLYSIVRHLSEIFNQVSCVIRLYDTQNGHFTKRVAQPENLLPSLDEYKPRSDGISYHVLETKEPYYIRSDSKAIPAVRSSLLGEGILSLAAVPLKIEGDVIGILYLYIRSLYEFSANDKRILDLFAAQAAVAIENTRLSEEIARQQLATIDAFQEIASSISIAAPTGRDRVLSQIIGSMVTLMGDDYLFVMRLFDEERQGLIVIDVRGEKVDSFPAFIPLGKGVTGWVAQHKIPQIIPDVHQNEQYWPGLKNARSELVVPMLREDKLIGVINIEHPEVDKFGDDDLKLAQVVAGLAVVAVENASLYQALDQKSQQLEALYEANLKIVARLDTYDVLSSIVESVYQLLRADIATIFPYNEEHGEFDGDGVRVDKEGDKPVDRPKSRGWAYHQLQKRASAFMSEVDLSVDEFVYQGQTAVAYGSIPLIFEGERMGLLVINYFQKHVFTSDEKQIAQSLAFGAAIALHNAQQFKSAQRIARLERWAELGQLAGNLAHRVGNQGGTIRLKTEEVIEQLQNLGVTETTIYHALEVIKRNNQYTLELSELLFKPLRASEERLAPTNMTLMIESALNNANIPVDVTIQRDYVPNLPTVKANRYFIEVFLEIISNAVKAMYQQPIKQLTIATQYTPYVVQILFTDTGIGIPEDQREKIFDLFVSSSQSNGKRQHLGFGLWWVRTFIRDNKGDIDVQSEVGKGSTFTITLPREVKK